MFLRTIRKIRVANASQLPYQAVPEVERPALYICHCNALTDTDVRQAAAQGACRPREVYEACGCTAQCGSCTRQILALLQDWETAEQPALVAAMA